MARHDRILPATFATYSDWIRGDMLKRGKQEHYLSEVLAAVVRCYGTQTTYNALARDTQHRPSRYRERLYRPAHFYGCPLASSRPCARTS